VGRDSRRQTGKQDPHGRITGNIEKPGTSVVCGDDGIFEVFVHQRLSAREHPRSHLNAFGTQDDCGRRRLRVAHAARGHRCLNDRILDAEERLDAVGHGSLSDIPRTIQARIHVRTGSNVHKVLKMGGVSHADTHARERVWVEQA